MLRFILSPWGHFHHSTTELWPQELVNKTSRLDFQRTARKQKLEASEFPNLNNDDQWNGDFWEGVNGPKGLPKDFWTSFKAFCILLYWSPPPIETLISAEKKADILISLTQPFRTNFLKKNFNNFELFLHQVLYSTVLSRFALSFLVSTHTNKNHPPTPLVGFCFVFGLNPTTHMSQDIFHIIRIRGLRWWGFAVREISPRLRALMEHMEQFGDDTLQGTSPYPTWGSSKNHRLKKWIWIRSQEGKDVAFC